MVKPWIVEQFVEQHGGRWIASWMHKGRTRIGYICKCGQVAETYWSNFRRCPNCKKCGTAKISGPACHLYDPDRKAVAMRKRFRKMCSQHIRRFMRATGQEKTKRTLDLLGYTPQQLQEYILNHPNFTACNGEEWHVDHIFPIKAFLDYGIYDLRIINSLANLQPLPGYDNLSKGSDYNEAEFIDWLGNNGIDIGNLVA